MLKFLLRRIAEMVPVLLAAITFAPTLEMNLLGEDVRIAFGIPLSVSAKNPFFDRK